MRSPVELWVYLSTSPLIWLTVTLCTWLAATELSVRLRRNPFASPVLTSVLGLSAALWLLDLPYERIFAAAQFVHFLLGPATVAIAVPLYRNGEQVPRLLLPIGAALIVGSLAAVASVLLLGHTVGLSQEVLISFMPKSVTAGVAMAISESLGGNPSLTAELVILTGIIGALIVTPYMNAMGITDYAARGFAAGLTSHGIGTARA
jgi:putative effector of murein hydrolase